MYRHSSRKLFLRRCRRSSSCPSGLSGFEDGRVEADEAGKFIIRRIAAGKLDGAVDEDEGQVFRTVVLEEVRHGLRLDEFQGRTGQVIAADVDAVLFQRVQDRRYAQEFRIDRRTAETGRAAHCLFKDFHMFHDERPPKEKFIYLHLSMYKLKKGPASLAAAGFVLCRHGTGLE